MDIDPRFLFDLYLFYAPADAEWGEGWLLSCLEVAELGVVVTGDSTDPDVPCLVRIKRGVT